MIKRLRRKFVLIVMAVVTLILLAIMFTMLTTTQRNNARMSESMLEQAIAMGEFLYEMPPNANNWAPPVGTVSFRTRLPVLVVEMDKNGNVDVIANQLFFVENDDIAPIAEIALSGNASMGVLSKYGLRYLRDNGKNSVRIAFADISMEQEVLKTQIISSLLIGGAAMLIFLLLSIILARWAVRPMEIAWERQKQFIANASHELKTPLTVILSNADMLRKNEHTGDEKNASRAEHIHAEAKRMKRLVEDMLTLAKSDNSQISALNAAVDFSYIVKSAVLICEPIIYDEKKMFSYEIEDGLIVMGDAARLQQVIHILMDNAQKYAPAGGTIQVSMKKTEQRTLLLKVSNTGIPIPQDELEKIFLRFYRLDESRSEHESFGLGLSIAQSIVKEHKGKIWAESEKAGKNHFYVSLPLA